MGALQYRFNVCVCNTLSCLALEYRFIVCLCDTLSCFMLLRSYNCDTVPLFVFVTHCRSVSLPVFFEKNKRKQTLTMPSIKRKTNAYSCLTTAHLLYSVCKGESLFVCHLS